MGFKIIQLFLLSVFSLSTLCLFEEENSQLTIVPPHHDGLVALWNLIGQNKLFLL